MIVLEIDEATPSLNAVYGHHWTRKHRERQRWGWLIRQALLAARVYERPRYPRARITVERYGPRMLDADNCRAGMKSAIFDPLKAEGLILDDSPAVIGEPRIEQHVGKERRTVVRIEEL